MLITIYLLRGHGARLITQFCYHGFGTQLYPIETEMVALTKENWCFILHMTFPWAKPMNQYCVQGWLSLHWDDFHIFINIFNRVWFIFTIWNDSYFLLLSECFCFWRRLTVFKHSVTFKLFEATWRICASVNRAIIVSNSCLSPCNDKSLSESMLI